MKDTSLDAFFDLKKSRALQNQERLILSKMQPNTVYTRREMADITKLDYSAVSARVNALLDVYIVIVGRKQNRTKRTAEALMLKLEKAAA